MKFILQQSITFGLMFIYGIFLGFFFDGYRSLISERKRRTAVLINITDLFFGILAGVIAFGILLFANWGELRFYIFLAIAGGISMYYYLK
ncbi:MAG: spore cortex biosynthesis protein YabQ [Halanaerobiaceae bacterium]